MINKAAGDALPFTVLLTSRDPAGEVEGRGEQVWDASVFSEGSLLPLNQLPEKKSIK